MSDTAFAPTSPPAHDHTHGQAHDHEHGHGHGHGHGHDHGPTLTLAERHDHEAETYDAMAEWILATWTDDDYRFDPAHIPFSNR
jgi:hypothetical protein